MITFTMVRSKINDLVKDIVLGHLKQSVSYRKIVKQVKHVGYNVSVATIHRIQHGKGEIREIFAKLAKLEYFQNAPQTLMLMSFERSAI